MKQLHLTNLTAMAIASVVAVRTRGYQYILKEFEDKRIDVIDNDKQPFKGNTWANEVPTQAEIVPLIPSITDVGNGLDSRLYCVQHTSSSLSIYEVLSTSPDTQTMSSLISKSASLISALNSTSTNHTIFVPTDSAFAKLPDLKAISWNETLEMLKYQITPHSFPLLRIISTPTIPTLLEPNTLNGQQRLKFAVDFKAMMPIVNSNSHITALDIHASNGFVHKLDSVVFPPKSVLEVIEGLPAEKFSLFRLAMIKTGMSESMRLENFVGSTIFAPTNSAFELLGSREISFLFGKSGEKYLRTLLEYHIAVRETLYSNAYYKTSTNATQDKLWDGVDEEFWDGNFPKGYRQFDLQTLLGGRRLMVEIARYSGAIGMMVNRMTLVAEKDWLARDGVIHSVERVLIPPKDQN